MEDALAKHYDHLQERDYNRSKAGLGSTSAASTLAPDGAAVAQHYNSLHDRHRTLSSGSDILHLRNLNNWVKSVLIGRHLKKGFVVLDLACGKGGDLGKFIRAAPGRYVGVDIAKTSLEDAVERLNSDSRRWGAVPVTLVECSLGGSSILEAAPREVEAATGLQRAGRRAEPSLLQFQLKPRSRLSGPRPRPQAP